VSGFANALQADGFATDDSYATKIIEIAQSPTMAQVLQSVSAPNSDPAAE
jgi:flagellar protein FlgJ